MISAVTQITMKSVGFLIAPVFSFFMSSGSLLAEIEPYTETLENPFYQFQYEADKYRLEALLYWAGIVDEYFAKTNQYPLSEGEMDYNIVQILHSDQEPYFTPDSPLFRRDLYIDGITHNTQEFISELSEGLGRDIDEYYDPQIAPSDFTIGIQYETLGGFGYILWTPCPTCGNTNVSIPRPYTKGTPIVAVGPEFLGNDMPGIVTVETLKQSPQFKEWMARPISKPGFFEDRAQNYLHDSKTR